MNMLPLNIILSLALGLSSGYILATIVGTEDNQAVSQTASTDDHDHDDPNDHMDGSHSHDEGMGHMPIEVMAEDAPVISNLQATKDAKSGWNISFETSDNFKFAPQNASSDNVDGEGHAHLYVDGVKITRLYSNDFYLADLAPGNHTITVSLNSNDHSTFKTPAGLVESSVTITQP